jgi:hypothetical protein
MTLYVTKILLITLLCYCNSYSINKVVTYTNSRNYISTFTSKVLNRKTQIFNSNSQIEDQVDIKNENEDLEIEFNSDAFIPTERWDFADDIFLITTTATGMHDCTDDYVHPYVQTSMNVYKYIHKCRHINGECMYMYTYIHINI